MKKEEKWTPHIIAAMAFVVFIVLGLACASAPPAILGQTLDETLGKPFTELKEMLGKTQAEFENLLGRKLTKGEVDEDGYFLEDYPKKGLSTLFSIDGEKKVNTVTIGAFTGQKEFVTLAEQTDEYFDASVFRINGSDGSRRWMVLNDFMITINPPNQRGIVFWVMSKN